MFVDPFLHPDMRKGPIPSSRDVEMARDSPYNIIWRYLLTHFFIQTCKNSQGFTPQHHLDMSMDPFFIQTCGNGQSFNPQNHLEISVDPFIHPNMWKWPEFHPATSFGDVCGPISSSRYVEMPRVSPHKNIIFT